MPWVKKGRIFVPQGNIPWIRSHASVPIPFVFEDRIRILFSSRDDSNRSRIGWLDVAIHDPAQILEFSTTPLLELGRLGTFDDNGMMPSSIVQFEEEIRLYYIGWNPGGTVPYRLAIGLAISRDRGKTFQRYADGPLMDRSLEEPYFCTTPCVRLEGNLWRMWYAACTHWDLVDGKPEAQYRIHYAESADGIAWQRRNLVCIDYDNFTKAIACPFVMSNTNGYEMWYSYRGIEGFRNDSQTSYRIGYATSPDGYQWQRQDDRVGIQRSETGWDSEMIEYASLFQEESKRYLFYNGNGFGKSGFGYAEWVDN